MNQPRHTDDSVPFATTLSDESPFFAHRHGVFYPKGHTVLVFSSADALAAAWHESFRAALPAGDAVALKPAQMAILARQSNEQATMMAKIVSAELKQMELLRQMADHQAGFLVLSNEHLSDVTLDELIARHRPIKGIRYGMITMEDLVAGNPPMIDDSPMGMNERPLGDRH